MTFSTPSGALISCPNCHQQFSAKVNQILDVRQDPTAKSRLLSGQATSIQCPNCGFRMNVATPLAYHDPEKNLLLIHVPMELNLSNDEQEKIVGQMTRAITDSLPMEHRKGYLLNPRRTFTLQGMIEAILEADGITPEMLEARRQKAQLIQDIVNANDQDQIALIEEKQDDIDEEFFQMMALMLESALINGQQQEAERIAQARNVLLEHTDYGQEVMASLQEQEAAIADVATAIQSLGAGATREDILDIAEDFANDRMRLQVLVSMVRQAMDYEFFNILADRIEASNSKQQRQDLRDLRDELVALTEQVDHQRRAQVQQANMIIQEMLNQPDIDELIGDYMPAVNDLVVAVLEANIQAAEQKGDEALLEQLVHLYDLIRQQIQQSAPPEVQFINELLTAENQTEARLMLLERGKEYGENLLHYMDALIEDLGARGANGIVEQLAELREEAARVLE